MPREPQPRRFRLPRHEELDKEQDAILEAHIEGSALITGGPGSGKTIMALLLAERLKRAKRPVRVLVYNKTLKEACKSQTAKGAVSLDGALSWVKRVANKHYELRYNGHSPPWDKLEDEFYRADEEGKPVSLPEETLILDEGQDMGDAFFYFLKRHDMQVIVTADQNQRITDTPSTEENIIRALEIGPDNILGLKRNHRNTRPIAALAASFHVGDGGATELPSREGGTAPVLIQTDNVLGVLEDALSYSMENPSKLIGVFTHNKERQMQVLEALQAKARRLDLSPRWIRFYNSEHQRPPALDFGMGGVVVLCAQSAKGLEFDDVFVAPINDFPVLHGREDWKTLFYVVLTRARERLFLVHDVHAKCPIAQYLPSDDAILKRVNRPRKGK